MSLEEISHGNANAFLTSELDPGNIPSLQWWFNWRCVSSFPPSSEMIFFWHIWFCLIFFNANCENRPARCHKLVLGQWLVHAFAALGLSRCHKGSGAEMLPPPHSWGELSPQLGATKLLETPPWGRGHPARPMGSSVEGLMPVVSWGCCISQMP